MQSQKLVLMFSVDCVLLEMLFLYTVIKIDFYSLLTGLFILYINNNYGLAHQGLCFEHHFDSILLNSLQRSMGAQVGSRTARLRHGPDTCWAW